MALHVRRTLARGGAHLTHLATAVAELAVPVTCGGCGRPGVAVCVACQEILSQPPQRVYPRRGRGVRCFALGPYEGPHRQLILAQKQRLRRELSYPTAGIVASGLTHLIATGELADPRLTRGGLVLIPAPTTRRAARQRGGDIVTRWCATATTLLPRSYRSRCLPLVHKRAHADDLVGLSAAERAAALADVIRVAWGGQAPDPHLLAGSCVVVLVDDVLTTGATVVATHSQLSAEGVRVDAVLTLAGA